MSPEMEVKLTGVMIGNDPSVVDCFSLHVFLFALLEREQVNASAFEALQAASFIEMMKAIVCSGLCLCVSRSQAEVLC